MSLSYLYTEFMDIMSAATDSISPLLFLEVPLNVLTLFFFYLGLLLPTNLTLSPVLSSVPTLRFFFFLPQPCLPNLPNAMRLNFP